MSDATASKFEVPVVEEKPSESSCVEFNLHSCYYNDFFLLRTPITINGRPAEIKLAESGPSRGSPYLYEKEMGIKLWLSKLLKIVAGPLHRHGVYHVDAFYYEHVPLFSVVFKSSEQLKEFLSSTEIIQSEISAAIDTEIEESGCNRSTAKPVRPCIKVGVETQLYLVSPTHGSQEDSDRDTKVYLVMCTLQTAAHCVDKLQKSMLCAFEPDLFKNTSLQDLPAKLADLQKELCEVVEWFGLGVQLQIPSSVLLTIRSDYRDQTNECRLQMLVTWEQLDSPTWLKLVRALNVIGMKVLAERIAKKYGVTELNCESDTKSPDMFQDSVTNKARNDLVITEREFLFKQEMLEKNKKLQDDLSLSLEEGNSSISVLHGNIKNLKLKITLLQQKLKTREEDLRFFEKANEQMEQNWFETIERLKKDPAEKIKTLKIELRIKEGELTQAKERLTNKEKELDEKRIELEKKTKENQQLQTEVNELKLSFISKQREMDLRVIEVEQMSLSQQASLNEAKMQLGLAQEELTIKQEEIEKQSEILAHNKEKIRELENESKILQLQQDCPNNTAGENSEAAHVQQQLSSLVTTDVELKQQHRMAEDNVLQIMFELEKAQKDLQLYKSMIPDINKCCVEMNASIVENHQVSYIQVSVISEDGNFCSGHHKIDVELTSLLDQSEAGTVTEVTKDKPGLYTVAYMPIKEGLCDILVKINDTPLPIGLLLRVHTCDWKPSFLLQLDKQIMGCPIYMAMYEFKAQKDEDLSFHERDLLYIIDTDEGDWWFAHSMATGKEGYVPNNYLKYLAESISGNILYKEEWFFGKMDQEEAKRQLMMPRNSHGSFLIRDSTTRQSVTDSATHTTREYTLSIRDSNKVKHYQIRQLENCNFYITSKKKSFQSLQELVAYYQQKSHGLSTKLRHPCLLFQSEEHQTVQVDRGKIQVINKLGDGQYSEVWEGTLNKKYPIAVKMLKPGATSDQIWKLLVEAEVMKRLSHPKLVGLYGISLHIYIVTELMKYGNMSEYLRGDGQSIILPQLINMSSQIAAGMDYLERQNYIHRDLTARNILVGGNLVCKISGLDHVQMLDDYDIDDEVMFEDQIWSWLELKWTAPEAALYYRFSIKSDVWSFGIVLHEIINYGRFPYACMTNAEVLERLEQGYRMPQQKGCPDKLYNIMLDCWSDDPATRPNFEFLQWQLDNYHHQLNSAHYQVNQSQQPNDIEWEIDRKQIQLIKKLGAGQFSEVWEGKCNSRIPVAVEVFKSGTVSAREFLQQAEVMKKLHHINLIPLYALCTKEEPIYIVTELMKHGSMLDYLQENGQSLKLPQLINMASQIAAGMEYLKQHNYIHQDLTAKNILIGDNLVCKISGLYHAYLMDSEDFYTKQGSLMVPEKWRAPEALIDQKFSIKSDVWSFGNVLYEIITYGQSPYPGMENEEVMERVQQGYRMPQPKSCPINLYHMMLDCWSEDPATRPSFEFLTTQLQAYNSEWEIDRSRIQLIKKLEIGQFSEIWEGKYKNLIAVAVEVLKLGTVSAREFLHQAETMKKLGHHANLIRLYGMCTQEEPIYIVTELIKPRIMLEYLQGDGRSLKLPQLINMASQIAAGMEHLEEQNYTHRDLAARNILVDDNMICRISGFDKVQMLDKDVCEDPADSKYPIKWTAPEAVLHNRFSIKSDVWSFGIVLYEIITYGQSPYPGMENEEVIERVQHGYRMPQPKSCPINLYHMMLDCWTEDPATRPSFEFLTTQLQAYNSEWEIDRSRIQLIKKLENGQFSEIWEGKYKNLIAVAVEVLKLGTVSAREFLHQAETMKKLGHHTNLIRLYGMCTQEEPIYIVTELIKPRIMLEYLQGDGRSLKLPQLINMASQIAAGMEHLEEQNYTHRDLAARNILVDDNMICRISGFDKVQMLDKDVCEDPADSKYPIKWTAPEAVLHNRFSIKSDVWSFGIVLYEIITYGQFPYPDMTNNEVINRIMQGYRMPQPKGCSDNLYGMMLDCWSKHPSTRPNFETLQWQLDNYHHQLQTAQVNQSQQVYDIEWEIDRSRIRLIQRLGTGQLFSEVWKGKCNSKIAAAVKVLKPGRVAATEFLQQAEVMKKFQHHANLIRLYGVCTQEEPIYIVTELMKHGSMLEYLQGDGRSLKLCQLIDMASQIADGMEYLKQYKYIHRDLAARNILVGDNLVCKISVLDHVQMIEKDVSEFPKDTKLPIKWTAPEALLYNRFSIKSDVWSFGIILYEIITYGHFPYPGMTDKEVLKRIQQGYRMPRPMGCPDKLYVMMLDCWSEDPATRPNFETLQWQLDILNRQLRLTVLTSPSQQPNDIEWEIDRRKIQLIKKLSTGQFGEVWEGKCNSRIPVAVEVLTMSAREFLQQAEVMKKLHHTNLSRLYALCTKEEPVYIVTELMKHGSMLNYLQGDGRSLKLPKLIEMSSQIAAGMDYLERHNCIHRDLTARNILIGDNMICKISRLYHVRLMNSEGFYTELGSPKIPIKWTAPEALKYGRYSVKSDVWSFGIVLYEIITYGRFPYPGMTNREVIERIQQGYRMPRPMGCPEKLYVMMLDCWSEDPATRPNFETLQWQLDILNYQLQLTTLTSPSQQTNDFEWEIDRKHIQLIKKLSTGQFGKVWEGKCNSRIPVAVEVLTMSAREFLQQAEVIKKLHHTNLIRLYALCTKEEPIYIVTELMKYGSLLKYIRGDGRSLKLPQMINMASQIAAGMDYLEQQNCVHLDLAARNILVGDNLICKISGLGLDQVQMIDKDVSELSESTKLFIKWTALEAVLYNRFSIKSNVWSFGIVLYEIITYGRFPYPGMIDHQVIEVICQGYRMPQPMDCPDKLYEIMLECWKEDPDTRPTFGTLQWQLKKFFTP